jgi:hypothetical protein
MLFTLFGFILIDAALSSAQTPALDSLRVTLEAQDLTLREALQQLVSQTKVQLVYHDALVAGVKTNGAFKNVTLRQALEEILAPAELTYGVMEDGLVVIMWRGWLERRGPSNAAIPPLGMAGPPDFIGAALQELALTETQKARVDSIQKMQREKAVALFRQRQNGGLDFESFRSARDRMNDDMMKQMQGVLTKEQYKKFKKELEQNRPPRQGFPPHRPEGGPPPHGRPPRRR